MHPSRVGFPSSWRAGSAAPATALAALLALGACADLEEPGRGVTPPSPLGPGLSSTDPASAVLAQLPPGTRRTDRPTPPRGRCPRFDETQLVVAGHAEHGQPGTLTATLVNDRLWNVRFEPVDFAAYEAAARAAGALPPERGAEIAPGTRWAATTASPRAIVWVDRRIEAQVNRWIAACS